MSLFVKDDKEVLLTITMILLCDSCQYYRESVNDESDWRERLWFFSLSATGEHALPKKDKNLVFNK